MKLATLKRGTRRYLAVQGLRGLREKGCVHTRYELEPPPPPAARSHHRRLTAPPETLDRFFANEAARAPAQAALLMHLLEHPEGRQPRTKLLQETGVGLQSLRALESRGLVRTVYADTHRLLRSRHRQRSPCPAVGCGGRLTRALRAGTIRAFLSPWRHGQRQDGSLPACSG